MTEVDRTRQELLDSHFRTTAEISALTGEYHRLLQQQGAAAFARQMAEDGPAAALAEAEQTEAAARARADDCDGRIKALEQRLDAIGRDLAALR